MSPRDKKQVSTFSKASHSSSSSSSPSPFLLHAHTKFQGRCFPPQSEMAYGRNLTSGQQVIVSRCGYAMMISADTHIRKNTRRRRQSGFAYNSQSPLSAAAHKSSSYVSACENIIMLY